MTTRRSTSNVWLNCARTIGLGDHHDELEKVGVLSRGYAQLTADQKAHVQAQVDTARARIEKEPKSMAWRLRARVGDRVKWYKDVDEVQ
jgi:hypothetical protein